MRIISLLLLLFVLQACQKKEVKVPEGILPPRVMINIMWDNFIADEIVNARYPVDTGTHKKDTIVILYQQITKAHGTTQQQFKKSMQFYEGRPDLLHIILDSLQNRAMAPLTSDRKDSTKVK